MPEWLRYRFKTQSVDDCRPIVFNPAYPWWCTSVAGDGSYAIIVAFLPKDEPLATYWDDAFAVEQQECDGPTFSDRFPKPESYPAEEP